MADINHLAVIKEGNDAIEEWRKSELKNREDGNAVLDLRGEKFSDSDLKGLNLSYADMTNCQISNADLSGTKFNHATLTNIKISNSTLEKTCFDGAKLHRARFFKVTAGEKGENRFHNAVLTNTEFKYSKLPKTEFHDGATLVSAKFIHSDISDSHIFNSNIENAQFINCQLKNTEFKKVDFNQALFRHVDFSHIKLDNVDFSGVKTIWRNKNLEQADQADNIKSLDNDLLLPVYQKFATWENIRLFGQLPLFLSSYLGLLFIPLILQAFDGANLRINFAVEWAQKILALPAHPDFILAEAVQKSLSTISPPTSLYVLCFACVFVAIGATIYHLRCPEKIKSFSRSQWENDLKGNLIHYSPMTWKHPMSRWISMTSYVIGLALVVITVLVNVIAVFL